MTSKIERAPGATRMGRLTRERFTWGTRIGFLSYPKPPFLLQNVEMLIANYETDAEAAADLLPDGLEIDLPATAGITLIRYGGGNLGVYNEAIQFIPCRWQGELKTYVVNIILDSDVAVAAGRELFGVPKRLGNVSLAHQGHAMLGTVERPQSVRLCSVTFKQEQCLAHEKFFLPPNLGLRIIPHPGAEGFSSAELIEYRTKARMSGFWSGSASIEFPSASAVDDWRILGVKSMKKAFYAWGDLEGTPGNILKTF